MRYITVNSASIGRNSRAKAIVSPIYDVFIKVGDEYILETSSYETISIFGFSKLVYAVNSPLPNGARCWLEVPDESEINF